MGEEAECRLVAITAFIESRPIPTCILLFPLPPQSSLDRSINGCIIGGESGAQVPSGRLQSFWLSSGSDDRLALKCLSRQARIPERVARWRRLGTRCEEGGRVHRLGEVVAHVERWMGYSKIRIFMESMGLSYNSLP